MHSALKIKLKEKLLPLYEELYMEFGNEAFIKIIYHLFMCKLVANGKKIKDCFL